MSKIKLELQEKKKINIAAFKIFYLSAISVGLPYSSLFT